VARAGCGGAGVGGSDDIRLPTRSRRPEATLKLNPAAVKRSYASNLTTRAGPAAILEGAMPTDTMSDAHPIEPSSFVERYGELTAVDRIRLDSRARDVYGFLGPNGGGKMTTLRMLRGVIRRDATSQAPGAR
jgi:ABC-type glutathione transport system ATPase component